MITLSFLLAACFNLASSQLALAQHTALMALYDALGVATDTEKKARKSDFFLSFLFRLSSCIVPALCGECALLWHVSDMFWEQCDCCVRMEVCLVWSDVSSDFA
jgi:hypothetical protein